VKYRMNKLIKEIKNMPAFIILGLIAILGAIWFGVKMKKSLKYDQIIKDITEPVDVTPKTTDDVMRSVGDPQLPDAGAVLGRGWFITLAPKTGPTSA
jgi:hypothetical protein